MYINLASCGPRTPIKIRNFTDKACPQIVVIKSFNVIVLSNKGLYTMSNTLALLSILK